MIFENETPPEYRTLYARDFTPGTRLVNSDGQECVVTKSGSFGEDRKCVSLDTGDVFCAWVGAKQKYPAVPAALPPPMTLYLTPKNAGRLFRRQGGEVFQCVAGCGLRHCGGEVFAISLDGPSSTFHTHTAAGMWIEVAPTIILAEKTS